jgi:hypothetical protein
MEVKPAQYNKSTFVDGPWPGWLCSAKGLKSSIPLAALLLIEVTEGSYKEFQQKEFKLLLNNHK